MLVIANETVVGEPLLERIRERAKQGPPRFLIVCPQSDPSMSAHPEADRRLRRALGVLRSEGIDVHGQVVHPDPYTAATHAVQRRAGRRDHRLDLPGREALDAGCGATSSNRLRKDTGLPVEHVEVAPEAEAAAR